MQASRVILCLGNNEHISLTSATLATTSEWGRTNTTKLIQRLAVCHHDSLLFAKVGLPCQILDNLCPRLLVRHHAIDFALRLDIS